MLENHSKRRENFDLEDDKDLIKEAEECRNHGYLLTGKFLGQGAYAKVYLGQATAEAITKNLKLKRAWENDKSLKVAIKIISTSSAPHVYITKFLPREVSTMSKCYKHENVIQMYDIFASTERIYLILEYAEGGDLLSYVNRCFSKQSKEDRLTEERVRAMFRDIISGIRFIHLRGIAHRDLKCENILLAKDRQAKLSDFGFAIEPGLSGELLKTHCGSYAYAPPEILRQEKYDGRLADIWSLGIILFAMVNGGLPFKQSDAKAVLKAMKKPIYFKDFVSADCKDLIKRLLIQKPHKRLSLNEIFSHKWMKLYQSDDKNDDEDAFGDVVKSRKKNKTLFDERNYTLSPENVLNYIKKRINFKRNEKQEKQEIHDKTSHRKKSSLTILPRSLQTPQDSAPSSHEPTHKETTKLVAIANSLPSHMKNFPKSTQLLFNHRLNFLRQTKKLNELKKIEDSLPQVVLIRKKQNSTPKNTNKDQRRIQERKSADRKNNLKTKSLNERRFLSKKDTKIETNLHLNTPKNSLNTIKSQKLDRSATPNILNLTVDTDRSVAQKRELPANNIEKGSPKIVSIQQKGRFGSISVPPAIQKSDELSKNTRQSREPINIGDSNIQKFTNDKDKIPLIYDQTKFDINKKDIETSLSRSISKKRQVIRNENNNVQLPKPMYVSQSPKLNSHQSNGSKCFQHYVYSKQVQDDRTKSKIYLKNPNYTLLQAAPKIKNKNRWTIENLNNNVTTSAKQGIATPKPTLTFFTDPKESSQYKKDLYSNIYNKICKENYQEFLRKSINLMDEKLLKKREQTSKNTLKISSRPPRATDVQFNERYVPTPRCGKNKFFRKKLSPYHSRDVFQNLIHNE